LCFIKYQQMLQNIQNNKENYKNGKTEEKTCNQKF